MDNNIEIMYYDFMIESIIKDRDVMESIGILKIQQMGCINENQSIQLIQENVLNTIYDFFKYIFEKIRGFIRKVINIFTGKSNSGDSNNSSEKDVKTANTPFVPNEKLIKKCEDIFKHLLPSDQGSVAAKCEYNRKEITLAASELHKGRFTNSCMNFIKELSNNVERYISQDSEKSKLENMLSIIKDNNEELDKISDLEQYKKQENIYVKDIPNMLYAYKDSNKSSKMIIDYSNQMDSNLKRIENNINNGINRIETSKQEISSTGNVQLVRNIISSSSALIMKALNLFIKLSQLNFRIIENALVQYTHFNSNNKE